jgi:hypothetical protein
MRTIFLLGLILFSHISHSQYLSIKKLLSFQTSSKQSIGQYLETRGWELIDFQEATDSSCNIVEWGFDVKDGKAVSRFTFFYDKQDPNRLLYQVASEDDYVGLEKQIEALNFTRYRTIIKRNGKGLIKVYKNKSHVITIESFKETTMDGYLFAIYSIEDYMNNFDE